MTREDYDKIDAVNFSTLKFILQSPAHYQDKLAHVQELQEAETEEQKQEAQDDRMRFILGTLVHAMSLEGKDLRDLYAIKPKGMSFAKTEGKIWKAEQRLPIITHEEAEGVPRMAEAIAKHKVASELLAACPLREHAVTAEINGVKCKALLDGYGSDKKRIPLITDLKTCRDASPRGFRQAVHNRDYDFQAEWYSRVTRAKYNLEQPPEFAWVAVETKRPYVVQCYYPKADTWQSGRKKADRALEILMKCRETGEWPGYSSELLGLSMDWKDEEGI